MTNDTLLQEREQIQAKIAARESAIVALRIAMANEKALLQHDRKGLTLIQGRIDKEHNDPRPRASGSFLPPPFKRINVGETYTSTRTFADCSHGATNDFLVITNTVAGQPQTNIVVTLFSVNSLHTLGSPVSNSMVFQ